MEKNFFFGQVQFCLHQIWINLLDKADKMAEIEKNERQIQQQQERDDEMREMALRLRRR